MKKLLTASTLRVFITIFSPFLIVISLLMLIGFKENQLVMSIAPFYVYPQLFMLIYWFSFVSNEITKKTDPELQYDLKRLNRYFKISKVVLSLCLVFGVISAILFNIELSESFTQIISGVSIIFGLFQLFAFFNWIYAFYKLSQVLSTYERQSKSGDYSGTLITFFFMPLTIGVIQNRIRRIFEN